MNKLLSIIGSDKITHGLVGYLVSTVSPVPIYGVAVAVTLGALKELYDYQNSDAHICDFYDFLATSLGGALGYAVILCLHS